MAYKSSFVGRDYKAPGQTGFAPLVEHIIDFLHKLTVTVVQCFWNVQYNVNEASINRLLIERYLQQWYRETVLVKLLITIHYLLSIGLFLFTNIGQEND